MGLREEIAAEMRGPGGHCSVGIYLAKQPDRAEWEELFADPEITSSALYRLMMKHGWDSSDQPVQRHKRGVCRCGRSS